MNYIVEHIAKTIANNTNASTKIFAGVSGGADSMAMLQALIEAKIFPTVLHVNFHLRGDDSNGDEQFVRNFCEKNNIELKVQTFNTELYASENGISIEMAARDLRYTWFKAECGDNGIICIAHNANDVAETALLNQCRGTGILGLCGIRERNSYILRPLLKFKHSDLLAFLNERGIAHREDYTNAQNIAQRNKIRNLVFPILEQINPSVIETFYQNSQRIQGINSLYREFIQMKRKEILQPIKSGLTQINTSDLLASSSPLTLIFELLSPMGFNEEQLNSLYEMCRKNSVGKFLESANYKVCFERNGVFLIEKAEAHKTEESQTLTICKCGLYNLNNSTVNVEIIDKTPEFTISKEPYCACFDADIATFPLTIRGWHIGDTFQPFGMNNHTKLVSDYFNDKKLNSIAKQEARILTTNNQIMWLIGYRTDERFKITPSTTRIIIITLQ